MVVSDVLCLPPAGEGAGTKGSAGSGGTGERALGIFVHEPGPRQPCGGEPAKAEAVWDVLERFGFALQNPGNEASHVVYMDELDLVVEILLAIGQEAG